MMDALLSRNLNAIAAPLQDFWTMHPDFSPDHTGRLYSHGHDEYPGVIGSPFAGQIDTLTRLIGGLLADGGPLCGNEIREADEECDAADSSSCPAVSTWIARRR